MANVSFRTESDEDARRIEAVLFALGYNVTREDEPALTHAQLIERKIACAAHSHKLTERERAVLHGVVLGQSYTAIATGMDISRATVKWHLHNIFAKLNTDNREGLVRAVLVATGGAE